MARSDRAINQCLVLKCCPCYQENGIQFCVDYWKLNDVTQKDSYPLPHIDDTIDALSGHSGSPHWT